LEFQNNSPIIGFKLKELQKSVVEEKMLCLSVESKSQGEIFQDISTFVDILNHRALQQAEQTAYIFLANGETETARLTYQQLDQKAKALAAQLQLQMSPGDRALLLYPSGEEFIIAFFACLYAGVIAVPVYPPRRNQKLSRLRAITRDAQAKLALTTTSLLSTIEEKFSSDPELVTVPCLATNNIPDKQAENWQKPNLSLEDIAFLQYTSGSTGMPKGVMVSHKNLLHNEKLIASAFRHTTETIVLGWLPLFHDMGLIGNVLQPLYVGFPSVIMPPEAFIQKPLRWLQAISRYNATSSGGPNFAYELCASKIKPQERENLDLSCWDVAFTGAEPVRAATLEKFANTFADYGFKREAFYPCYGMAETTLFVSGGIKSQSPVIEAVDKLALLENNAVTINSQHPNAQLLVGCGHAWLSETIVIVNPESLTECRDGEIGEIWVSSDSVAQGYWNRPEQTAETFQAYLADTQVGPFLRTGDLGFLLAGELFITGRLKDLIIVQGRNHYPQDIEATVQQSNSALRKDYGAAFSIEIAGQERLVVVQEVERSYLRKLDYPVVIQQIISSVAEEHQLDVYAVALLKTASIPKTSSGKIQRIACRTAFLAGTLDVIGDWSKIPSQKKDFIKLESDVNHLLEKLKTFSQLSESSEGNTNQSLFRIDEDIEQWLIAKFAELKETTYENIDIRQNIGFDSLVAAELNNLFNTNWGVEIPIDNFIEGVSVTGLTALLTNKISETRWKSTEQIDQMNDEEVDALLSSILSK
jgi:myxalamid-type polyketide synthase MxaB